MPNFADDERVRILNEKIQTESDSKKLISLVDELTRLVDEHSAARNPPSVPKKTENGSGINDK